MTKELFEALDALCDMWNQYCPPPWTHDFMSAGENAEDVLNKYELLQYDKERGGEVVNYIKLEQLKNSLTPINEPL